MRESVDFAIWRSAPRVVSSLPEAAARHLGRRIGYLLSFVDRKRLRFAARHMRRATEDGGDVMGAARKVFANYGRYWGELLWLRADRLDSVAQHLLLEGSQHLTQARDGGKGMILAVPHLGNWEVGARVFVEMGIPVTVVAEALMDRCAREWFMATRRLLGMEVLFTGESNALVRKLARRLDRGGAVGLMCDRDLTGAGPEVLFFGEKTTLPGGPALLAELTGAPILPAAIYFRSGRGHRAVVLPPLAPPCLGSQTERRQALTQEMARKIETLVRAAPTQWHLLQPNWPSDRRLL